MKNIYEKPYLHLIIMEQDVIVTSSNDEDRDQSQDDIYN